jgi:hypothetical protein
MREIEEVEDDGNENDGAEGDDEENEEVFYVE